MQRERLDLKWFLRSFRLLKEYYHIVLSKIVVVQAAADRDAGVCLRLDVCVSTRRRIQRHHPQWQPRYTQYGL